jgi:spore germination protein KA
MIAYIDGLVNKDLIDRDIILPIKSKKFDGDIYTAIKVIYNEVDDINICIQNVLQGNVALFYENNKNILVIEEFKQWDKRQVDEPSAEVVIRGPREGFTENIRTNTSLLRRKIKTPDLVFEKLILGKQTNTIINIVYIDGIVNQDVLKELKRRLAKINTDSILESGHIEQYIEESPFSPFSGVGVTQKPDIVAAKILEGRVAVICDGTPHVLTVPDLFFENLRSAEDYYDRSLITSINRLLRLFGLFITILLPALYVAITTYNQEMIPYVFLNSLITSTVKTPMPAAAEIFLLILFFNLIKEAGIRLPKGVGSAITIVGSLIIGEAAVNAGLVGAPMVIIVALTSVTSFVQPNLNEFVIIYRLLFLILASVMGLIGIGSGIVIMLTQLISKTSFGIPILSTFSKSEMKDSVIRFPLESLKYRPPSIAKDNVKRRG